MKIKLPGASLSALARFITSRPLASSLAATAVLLVAALLLPLTLMGGSYVGDSGVAAAMFADWWRGGNTYRAQRLASVTGESERYAEARLNELVAECLPPDEGAATLNSGIDLVTLTNADGGQVRLCREWRLTAGTWARWIDVCFDMDTGFVYYIYLSGQRLSGSAADAVSADSLAETLYLSDGWEMLSTGEQVYESGRTGVTGVLTRAGSEISFSMDTDALRAADGYFDIRYTCIG